MPRVRTIGSSRGARSSTGTPRSRADRTDDPASLAARLDSERVTSVLSLRRTRAFTSTTAALVEPPSRPQRRSRVSGNGGAPSAAPRARAERTRCRRRRCDSRAPRGTRRSGARAPTRRRRAPRSRSAPCLHRTRSGGRPGRSSRWTLHRQCGQWLRCCVPAASAPTSARQCWQRKTEGSEAGWRRGGIRSGSSGSCRKLRDMVCSSRRRPRGRGVQVGLSRSRAGKWRGWDGASGERPWQT